MANKKSAIKRIRQNIKRRQQNRAQMGALRTAAKKVRAAVAAKDLKTAQAALQNAEKQLSSAANKHLIHKRNASRKISRLTLAVNSLR